MPDEQAALAEVLRCYAASDVPEHGAGSLPHGYDDLWCGDHCNNIECPVQAPHERCTVDCLTAAGEGLLEVPVWRGLILGKDLEVRDAR